MAIDQEVLDVLLRVVGVRSFQASMAEARSSVASLGTTAEGTGAELAAMGSRGEKAALLARKALKFTAVGMAIAAAEGIKSSIEFQKQMTMIQTQAGASAGDVKYLSDQVLQMAHVLPQGPIELAKGAYHMQSVFQNAKTAAEGLKIAAQGAAIGGANLEDTSTALAAATRAIYYNLTPAQIGTRQLGHTMGVLNAIIGAGNMRMQDLSLAIGTQFIPAGIRAGLTMEDMGGALATLVDQGQHADNAATHLRMAFTLMGSSSKIAQKNLARIGIDSIKLGATLHGPDGLVNGLRLVRQNLEQKFPTIGTQIANIRNPRDADMLAKRFQVISRAFGGARSSATIMLLLNSLDMLEGKTNTVYLRSNKMHEAWVRYTQTAAYKIHTAWSGLQADLTKVGQHMQGPAVAAILALIGALDFLVRHFNTLSKVLLVLIAVWGTYKAIMWGVVAVTKTLEAIELLQVVLSLIPAVTSLADAWVLLGAAFEASGIGLVITLVAALIVGVALAVYEIIKHWDAIKHGFAAAIAYMKDHWVAFMAIGGMLLGPMGMAIVYILTHWNQVKHFVIGVWHAIGDAAKAVWGAIGGFVKAYVNLLIRELNLVISVIDFIIKAYNKIPSLFRPTGKIGTIGHIGLIGGHHDHPKPPDNSPRGGFPGFAPAFSGHLTVAHPRHHNPAPTESYAEGAYRESSRIPPDHFHFYLDGKELTSVVTKRIADQRARR